ncbi:MAG: chemotaxis protein CheA [Candidatus Omnitrophota bacterium]
MDIKQYKELFISEGRELLSSLNSCLVSLEKNPNDKECLNEIFRHAHTLKGMSASMGYEEITKLTHEMESVLDLLRHGKLQAEKETVDLLFESFDILEVLVGKIAVEEDKDKLGGDKKKDFISLLSGKLEKLRADFSENTENKKEDIKEEKRSNLRLEDPDRIEIIEKSKQGFSTYRVTVSLKKDCQLKEARILVVVKLLEEMGKVIRAQFIYNQLKNGKFGRHFGLFFTTKESIDLIKEKVEAIQDVDKIIFKPLEIDEVLLKTVDSRELMVDSKELNTHDPLLKTHDSQLTTHDKTPKREAHMVRVSLDKLDNLMNLAGELVINKIRLSNIGQVLENKPLSEALTQMGRLTDGLQIGIMETRLVPMDYIFNRFPRMARDLAAQEKKEIDLHIEGADIGLDRTILDEINDPLIHLLRNAVNHGIEIPEIREQLGKKPCGKIKLSAKRERNFVIIEVSDDGRGINPAEIKSLAIDKGIVSAQEADKLSEQELIMLITSAGISTSKQITQISGRGVGMDLVKKKVESFGGGLNIESKVNKGTKFTLKLPLSMAIIQALLVKVGTETYSIPLVNITETIKIHTAAIKTMEHHEVVPYRDEVLPLVRLREKFGFSGEIVPLQGKSAEYIPVVVVETSHKKTGLVVDKLLGQQEVVIKSLKGAIKNMPGIAGATILGDGRVALIVDIASIV